MAYGELQRIAATYGLTTSEFEFYLTIPSLKGDQDRVFCPYHILSRPQAEEFGWDWHILLSLANYMLRTMRARCNKHAEKAGYYGEPEMDANRLICWMAAYFSNKIRALKEERPDANRQEIASHILDRWGLPIVPWECHPFKASLCKGPDHLHNRSCHHRSHRRHYRSRHIFETISRGGGGIAMKFGIVHAESFDPIRHIDLARSTIAIDSVLTNVAMWNHSADSWDGIRSALCQVPLHHPFWRADSSLGNEIWKGQWDRTITHRAHLSICVFSLSTFGSPAPFPPAQISSVKSVPPSSTTPGF